MMAPKRLRNNREIPCAILEGNDVVDLFVMFVSSNVMNNKISAGHSTIVFNSTTDRHNDKVKFQRRTSRLCYSIYIQSGEPQHIIDLYSATPNLARVRCRI